MTSLSWGHDKHGSSWAKLDPCLAWKYSPCNNCQSFLVNSQGKWHEIMKWYEASAEFKSTFPQLPSGRRGYWQKIYKGKEKIGICVLTFLSELMGKKIWFTCGPNSPLAIIQFSSNLFHCKVEGQHSSIWSSKMCSSKTMRENWAESEAWPDYRNLIRSFVPCRQGTFKMRYCICQSGWSAEASDLWLMCIRRVRCSKPQSIQHHLNKL